jgi:DNA mismatch repair protein MutL
VTETPTIRPLDEETVRQIAAGEVVERPASVVKELVENSLDADATRVTVAVESGGVDGIRVRDDGVGMTATDLERAVEEHTTSKIAGMADLDRVGSLGFRGEALHTIGAVSRLTVRSRPPDGRGHELVVEGGDAGEVTPAGCPPGTVVAVDDLFYNTPARKKFLKSEPTEFDHINRVVTQYALANPAVAVALEHDGREVFATGGSGDLESAVLAVYGREVAESMVRIEATDPDGPVESVSGLVSHPETTRAGREYLSTFVNGRYVTAGTLRDAVLDGYGDQLAPDRYPFAVLFLDVAPDAVDANVHPRKLEVRFDDEDGIRDAVTAAVREALLDAGLVRTGAPRGRSTPDETTIDPASPDREVAGGVVTDDGGRPGSAESPPDTSDRPVSTDSAAGATGVAGTDADAESGSRPTDDCDVGAEGDRADHAGRPGGIVAPTEQGTLGGETRSTAERREFEHLPPMRVLGQFDDTYLVAEAPDGLVLLDQHAADERVNYERLRAEMRGETPTQALASPVELELTARESSLFDRFRDALAEMGFHAERTGERTVEVRTVPTALDESLDPSLLCDALSGFGEDDAAETVDAVVDDLLADLACYPSITGNTSLTEGSVVGLLDALDDCENPFACPHGRPVVVSLDRDEIDERFERDYPGHAGRRAE